MNDFYFHDRFIKRCFGKPICSIAIILELLLFKLNFINNNFNY